MVFPLGKAVAARLAEGDRRPRQALELDRHVLEDVAEPGSLVLLHPPHEAAVLAVGAAVLGERRQRRQQPLAEAGKLRRRIALELAEVEAQADHRPAGVGVGTAIDPSLQDFHQACISGWKEFSWSFSTRD